MEHIVENLSVGNVDFFLVEVDIDVSDRVVAMTKCMGNGILGDIDACCYGSPGMTSQ